MIAGHSLGAGIARITTLLILKLNQFPKAALELYTYGESRVGNKAMADFCNKQKITSARVVERYNNRQ